MYSSLKPFLAKKHLNNLPICSKISILHILGSGFSNLGTVLGCRHSFFKIQEMAKKSRHSKLQDFWLFKKGLKWLQFEKYESQLQKENFFGFLLQNAFKKVIFFKSLFPKESGQKSKKLILKFVLFDELKLLLNKSIFPFFNTFPLSQGFQAAIFDGNFPKVFSALNPKITSDLPYDLCFTNYRQI